MIWYRTNTDRTDCFGANAQKGERVAPQMIRCERRPQIVGTACGLARPDLGDAAAIANAWVSAADFAASVTPDCCAFRGSFLAFSPCLDTARGNIVVAIRPALIVRRVVCTVTRSAVTSASGQRGFQKRADIDLLGGAQRAGIMGSTQHTVTGRAALDISLNGFPRGTVSKSRTDGELFREVKLNRGRVDDADIDCCGEPQLRYELGLDLRPM